MALVAHLSIGIFALPFFIYYICVAFIRAILYKIILTSTFVEARANTIHINKLVVALAYYLLRIDSSNCSIGLFFARMASDFIACAP